MSDDEGDWDDGLGRGGGRGRGVGGGVGGGGRGGGRRTVNLHPAGRSSNLVAQLSRLPLAPIGVTSFIVCVAELPPATTWYALDGLSEPSAAALFAAGRAGGPPPRFLSDTHRGYDSVGVAAASRSRRIHLVVCRAQGPAGAAAAVLPPAAVLPVPPPVLPPAAVPPVPPAAAVLPPVPPVPSVELLGLPLGVGAGMAAAVIAEAAAAAVIGLGDLAGVDALLVCVPSAHPAVWWYVRPGAHLAALYAAAVDGWMTPAAAAALATAGTRLTDSVLRDALLSVPMRALALHIR